MYRQQFDRPGQVMQPGSIDNTKNAYNHSKVISDLQLHRHTILHITNSHYPSHHKVTVSFTSQIHSILHITKSHYPSHHKITTSFTVTPLFKVKVKLPFPGGQGHPKLLPQLGPHLRSDGHQSGLPLLPGDRVSSGLL